MKQDAGHLKVGLVTPYAWTSRWGVNRSVSGLALALAGRGYDVSVIAPAEERDEARAARQRARLDRRAAKSKGRWVAEQPSPEAAESENNSESRGEPFTIHRVPGTFRVPYSESLANLAPPLEVTNRLNDLLARERFDILHIHEPYPPGLSFTALRLAHCPVVATFYTSGERLLSYQLMRPVVERFFSRLDSRICTSQNTRRVAAGYFPGEYKVIGSGVDTARFTPGGPPREGAPPLILYAAWREPRKALALLLRSIRLLPADTPPFELSIIGGEAAWRTGRLTVPRRLRGVVSLNGLVARADLPETYSKAEILCAPYAASSHATAILEAMASGVAVIAPGQGCIKELVGEGNEGFLLDHPYSYNLAAGLLDLLDKAGQRRSMGEAAAAKAAGFAWDRTVVEIEGVYQEAYGRRLRTRPSHKAFEAAREEEMILADLHTHTSYSDDCVTTPEDLLIACEESGISALAVTDHNEIDGALEVSRLAPENMHIIVGEEIKTTEGEIIGLYIKERIPPGLSAEETIARIKEQEGLVYVPHPFDPMHLTPSYDLLARNAADIDIIEVYNPRITFTSFNEKARKLARKYNIPGGAGSDCHVVEGVGTAMLSLRKFDSPHGLLACLKEADIIRSDKSPLYLHSLKLLKNRRAQTGPS